MYVNLISNGTILNGQLHKPNNKANATSFQGAKSRKLLNQISQANYFSKMKVTFEEMVDIYSELGYDVIYKRGSHAIVPINKHYNLPLVIPHGDKYVHPNDLKRLKYILSGQYDKAKLV